MGAVTKTCSACKESKPLALFSRLVRSKDGYNGRCKSCMSAVEKQWRQELPEEHRKRKAAVVTAWRLANPEKVKQFAKTSYQRSGGKRKESIKKWREDNKEHCAAVAKRWREDNKEHLQKIIAEWYVQNKSARKAQMKAWAEKNPERIAEFSRRWKAKNPDKVRTHQKRAQVKRVENLTDSYIVGLIKGQIGNWGVVVPPELVAMKRQYLLINRKLKEENEQHN